MIEIYLEHHLLLIAASWAIEFLILSPIVLKFSKHKAPIGIGYRATAYGYATSITYDAKTTFAATNATAL